MVGNSGPWYCRCWSVRVCCCCSCIPSTALNEYVRLEYVWVFLQIRKHSIVDIEFDRRFVTRSSIWNTAEQIIRMKSFIRVPFYWFCVASFLILKWLINNICVHYIKLFRTYFFIAVPNRARLAYRNSQHVFVKTDEYPHIVRLFICPFHLFHLVCCWGKA